MWNVGECFRDHGRDGGELKRSHEGSKRAATSSVKLGRGKEKQARAFFFRFGRGRI